MLMSSDDGGVDHRVFVVRIVHRLDENDYCPTRCCVRAWPADPQLGSIPRKLSRAPASSKSLPKRRLPINHALPDLQIPYLRTRPSLQNRGLIIQRSAAHNACNFTPRPECERKPEHACQSKCERQQKRARQRLSRRRLPRRRVGPALSLGSRRGNCGRGGDRLRLRGRRRRLGRRPATAGALLVLHGPQPTERLLGQLPVARRGQIGTSSADRLRGRPGAAMTAAATRGIFFPFLEKRAIVPVCRKDRARSEQTGLGRAAG